MSVLRGSCPRAINGRLCGATTVSALGYCLHCGAYRPEHEQTPVASHITGAAEDWINPETKRASCPSCDGYGYHEDGSDDGELCDVCQGRGVARAATAEQWIKERSS